MTYEKLNLKNNDVLDETHIAHMEDGIANAGGGSLTIMVTVNADTGEFVFDRTINDIVDDVTNCNGNATLIFNMGGTIVMPLNCTELTSNTALFTTIGVSGAIDGVVYTTDSVSVIVFSFEKNDDGGAYAFGQTPLSI